MGEFYHLKKSGLGLHAPSIACQRGFEPIKGIGEADFGQWVVKIPRADSSQQWKTAFHSGMSTSLKRGYEASMRNLKSAITYEIWKKTAYHTERAGDKWLHWHQPSTALVISASQNINWVDKRGRYGGNFLFICFVPCFLFFTSTFDCFDQEKLVAHHLLYL